MGNVVEQVDQFMTEKGLKFKIKFTKRPGHASTYVAKKKGDPDKVFVCIGGDGSINEVGRALINEKNQVGIIPMGSGNGLARHLGIPLDVKGALNTLIHGETIKMDVGFINDRPFFVTAGVGFEAEVAHHFSQRQTRGLIGYVKETLRLFPTYKPREYHISSSSIDKKVKAFSITVANSSQYGNDAIVAHRASVRDGLLDLSIIKSYPKVFGPQVGLRLFMANLHQSRYFRGKQADRFEIDGLMGEMNCHTHLDGDTYDMEFPLKANVLKEGLKIIVPKGGKI